MKRALLGFVALANLAIAQTGSWDCARMISQLSSQSPAPTCGATPAPYSYQFVFRVFMENIYTYAQGPSQSPTAVAPGWCEGAYINCRTPTATVNIVESGTNWVWTATTVGTPPWPFPFPSVGCAGQTTSTTPPVTMADFHCACTANTCNQPGCSCQCPTPNPTCTATYNANGPKRSSESLPVSEHSWLLHTLLPISTSRRTVLCANRDAHHRRR